MHSNSPIYTARIIKAFLEEKGIEVVEWPSHLQDLNSVENLWVMLKRKIHEQYPELLEADDSDVARERLIEAAVEMCNNLEDE